MNKFMWNVRTSLASVFAVLAASTLVACNGGGGGGVTITTPTTVTVTCPNGTASTAATTDLANAACPAPKVLSVLPAGGDIAVSPDTFTGVIVVTDSKLDPSSLTTVNVTLKAGGTSPVTGTVYATEDTSLPVVTTAPSKVFRFAPSTKLNYGQSYTFTATVRDTLGKELAMSSMFTTAVISCTPPQVPDSTGSACVTPWWPPTNITPMNVKVSGANQLPAGCNAWADQCWKDAVTNGTVKLVATSATMAGSNSRSVVFAYFRNTTELFGVTGLGNVLPVYADDGSLVGQDISGGVAQEIDWVYGNANGAIAHIKVAGTCVQYSWDAVAKIWSSAPATCPV